MNTVHIFIKCLYLLTAFTTRSYAVTTTQYLGNTKHPVMPSSCYYEELDLAVPVNETVRPTNIEFKCVAITCRDDYVLLIKHCDRIPLNHGCRVIPDDYSKPHPDCCYRVICNY